MRMLVRVLRGWHLENAGDDKWLPVPVPEGSDQIAVHLADEFQRYLFGTYRFTFAVIRAAPKEFVSHRGHHAEGPLVALRLTLRERVQVSNFGRGEKHSGGIRTGGDAGSAPDACGGVKGSVCILF